MKKNRQKTVGYVVCQGTGPLGWTMLNKFYRLIPCGHSKPWCTSFYTRDAAKSAIIAERSYGILTNNESHTRWANQLTIVRLVAWV